MADASDTEVAGFVDKLAAFRGSLSATEQSIFDEMLTAALAPADSEVQGFDKNLPPKQREALMTSVLTNIANMKHESLKGIAQNLRG